MKKRKILQSVITLSAVLAVCFSLTACGSSSGNNPVGSSGSSAFSGSSAVPAAPTVDPDSVPDVSYKYYTTPVDESVTALGIDNPIFDGALTIEEATHALKYPEAAAPYNAEKTWDQSMVTTEFTELAPTKLFDNCYFIGTTSAGGLLFDTTEGLVLLDTGDNDYSAVIFENGIKKLGFDPADVVLIITNHEHGDHFGGINYFIRNCCPDAKVAMGLYAWNQMNLPELPEINGNVYDPFSKQWESVIRCDIFLTDGMALKVGDFRIAAFYTPGHAVGCMSFIFPVTWNGEQHMAGYVGGSAVQSDESEFNEYRAGLEYFAGVSRFAGCDVGLKPHMRDSELEPLRNLKEGDPNPLILGTEDYNDVYLQGYRDSLNRAFAQGLIVPSPGFAFPKQ